MSTVLPSILVLGGVGFIGRHLVHFLVQNNVAGYIRVADKRHYQMAYLPEDMIASFKNDKVSFVQADLAKETGIEKAFGDQQYDYVVNLCGETRCSMSEQEYTDKIVKPAGLGTAKAQATGVRRWIEVSTAHVYQSDKAAASESSPVSAWTRIGINRAQAEQVVRDSGVPSVILRPAIVYGPGDLSGLTPRLACAAVYQKKGEKMKFLWNKDLRINSVHVADVVRAIVHCATSSNVSEGAVYNLVDKTDLTQGKVADMLAVLFGIKTGFMGKMLSAAAAKLSLDSVAEMSNDKHVPPFAELCREHNVLNTPVTPYIDKELLLNNHLSADGTAIESTGFTYEVPQCTVESLKPVVTSFIQQGLFPPVVQ
ncbi:MAG: hypothetical protein MHM6MM_004579 [Cercozoa sp. M6MM]